MIIAMMILVALLALIGSLGWIFNEMTSRPASKTPEIVGKPIEDVNFSTKTLVVNADQDEAHRWVLKQESATLDMSFNSQQRNTMLELKGVFVNLHEKECQSLRVDVVLLSESGESILKFDKILLGPNQPSVGSYEHVPFGIQEPLGQLKLDSVHQITVQIKESNCQKNVSTFKSVPTSVDLLPIKPNGIDFSFFMEKIDASTNDHLGLHHFEAVVECRNTGLMPIALLTFNVQFIDENGNQLETSKEMTLISKEHPPLSIGESRFVRVKRPFSEKPIHHAKLIISRLE